MPPATLTEECVSPFPGTSVANRWLPLFGDGAELLHYAQIIVALPLLDEVRGEDGPVAGWPPSSMNSSNLAGVLSTSALAGVPPAFLFMWSGETCYLAHGGA